MTAINLPTARAAAHREALAVLADENRALHAELAHMATKLAAAMALADRAIRERDRIVGAAQAIDRYIDILPGPMPGGRGFWKLLDDLLIALTNVPDEPPQVAARCDERTQSPRGDWVRCILPAGHDSSEVSSDD